MNEMDFSELTRLASGHIEARIIQTAVELGIFDSIGSERLEASALALALGTHRRATELLLNALTALGLLSKAADRFALTPVATKYLAKSSAHYLGGMVLFDASLWNCWERLGDAVRSGEPARSPDMYQADPRETERFIAAMDSLVNARGDAEIVASAIDWSGATELLDVGSGPASYPIHLCREFPRLRAAIFDLPGTLKITERFVREAGMAERIKLIAGDYRQDLIPGSYDAIFLSNIIHGEDNQNNEALIGKLAKNLKPSGQLVIKDHILDESCANPPVGAIFSLLMLLTTVGGRCYSFGEIKVWLELAGLSDIRQIDLPPPLTSALMIGVKRARNQKLLSN